MQLTASRRHPSRGWRRRLVRTRAPALQLIRGWADEAVSLTVRSSRLVSSIRVALRNHEDIACADTRPVARMAHRASCLGFRGLADLSQATHRRCVNRLRGRARRGVVLWLGGQSRQAPGRPAVRAEVHAAQSGQPMVRRESATLRRTQSQRAIETGRERTVPYRPRLWPSTTAASDAFKASGLHPGTAEESPESLAPLRGVAALATPAVFRLD